MVIENSIQKSKTEKPVLIVNSFERKTGIGRYVEILHSAVCEIGALLTLDFIPPTKIKSDTFEGIHLKGISAEKFPNLSKSINTMFQGPLFARPLSGYANKFRILHYSDPGIKPLNNDGIITIHDLTMLGKSSISDVYGRVCKGNLKKYRHFQNVIVDSDYVKGEVENNGFEGKVHLIHLAPSPNFFPLNKDKAEIKMQLGLPINKKLLLSISTKSERKNLPFLSRAVEALGNDYSLVRVGDGMMNAINYSNVDDSTLNMLYNASDALLFPSKEEGFGFPAIEALATGLPVLALDIPTMNEVTGNAFPLSDGTIADYVKNIIEVTNSQDDLKKIAIQRAKHFSLEKFKHSMLNLYNTILSNYI